MYRNCSVLLLAFGFWFSKSVSLTVNRQTKTSEESWTVSFNWFQSLFSKDSFWNWLWTIFFKDNFQCDFSILPQCKLAHIINFFVLPPNVLLYLQFFYKQKLFSLERDNSRRIIFFWSCRKGFSSTYFSRNQRTLTRDKKRLKIASINK